MKPPAGWSVTVADRPGLLITEVLHCQLIYGWLTRPQRDALHTAAEGQPASGHPRVLERLRQRGLLAEDNTPTLVGQLVIKWNRQSTVEAA